MNLRVIGAKKLILYQSRILPLTRVKLLPGFNNYPAASSGVSLVIPAKAGIQEHI